MSPRPDRSDGSTVTEQARRGRRARDAGQWAEARAGYKAALEATVPASSTEAVRAEIAGELGLCELALHDYRDAAEHLASSLEQRSVLRLPLQLRFEAGQRKAAPHVATLYLSVNPPDAEVLLDGKAIGRPARSYRLFLEPGLHMVRLRSRGHEDAFQSFDAGAGQVHAITMQLPRAAEPVASPLPTPPEPLQPIKPSAPPPARAATPDRWASWPGALRMTGIALTTATASVGVMFMVRATVLHGDLDERNAGLDDLGWTSYACRQPTPPSACAELVRLQKEQERYAELGTAMVVASGVLGAATVASFFTDFSFTRSAPRRDSAWMVFLPMAAPRQIGIVVRGSL